MIEIALIFLAGALFGAAATVAAGYILLTRKPFLRFK